MWLGTWQNGIHSSLDILHVTVELLGQREAPVCVLYRRQPFPGIEQKRPNKAGDLGDHCPLQAMCKWKVVARALGQTALLSRSPRGRH